MKQLSILGRVIELLALTFSGMSAGEVIRPSINPDFVPRRVIVRQPAQSE